MESASSDTNRTYDTPVVINLDDNLVTVSEAEAAAAAAGTEGRQRSSTLLHKLVSAHRSAPAVEVHRQVSQRHVQIAPR